MGDSIKSLKTLPQKLDDKSLNQQQRFKLANSPYILWFRRRIKEIRSEDPFTAHKLVCKRLGAEWKNLTAEEKAPFIEEAKSLLDQSKTNYIDQSKIKLQKTVKDGKPNNATYSEYSGGCHDVVQSDLISLNKRCSGMIPQIKTGLPPSHLQSEKPPNSPELFPSPLDCFEEECANTKSSSEYTPQGLTIPKRFDLLDTSNFSSDINISGFNLKQSDKEYSESRDFIQRYGDKEYTIL